MAIVSKALIGLGKELRQASVDVALVLQDAVNPSGRRSRFCVPDDAAYEDRCHGLKLGQRVASIRASCATRCSPASR